MCSRHRAGKRRRRRPLRSRSRCPNRLLLRSKASAASAGGRSADSITFLVEHDLFRKPVSTFRDHALVMKSAWAERDAEAAVARYADAPRDVALRVYTTRLLGADPKLVLHGGGNTSVKTTARDLLGDAVEVICVRSEERRVGKEC